MKHPSFIFFIFITGCFQLPAQTPIRQEDGSIKKEIDYVAMLCGKEWKWDEGIIGNQQFESIVFSLEYDTNKTFVYNQREEKNYWRLSGNHLIHSIAPFGQKRKNPYGIFEGRFEITRITDSVLVLTKVDGKKDNPATVLHFIRGGLVPVIGEYANQKYSYQVPRSVLPVPEGMNKNLINELQVNESATITSIEKFGKYPNGITTETLTQHDCINIKTVVKKAGVLVAVIEKKYNKTSSVISYSFNGQTISAAEYESFQIGN